MDPSTIYGIDLVGADCEEEDASGSTQSVPSAEEERNPKESPLKSGPLTPVTEEEPSSANSPTSERQAQSHPLEDPLVPSLSPRTIDAILDQLQLDDPINLSLIKDLNVGGDGYGEDNNDFERSVTSEIASIQKLIEGIDLSLSLSSSQVAGGNKPENPAAAEEEFENENDQVPTSDRERNIDDVLKEYEELERSLSQASGVDESFRSEIAPLPSSSFLGNSDNRPSVQAQAPRPTETLSTTATKSVQVPLIKPPVLKSVVLQSPPPPSPPTKENSNKENDATQPQLEMFAPPPLIKSKSPYKSHGSTRTKPVSAKKNLDSSHPKSSRVEGSHSEHGIKTTSQSQSNSARLTASSTVASERNNTQDAFKPRNRRMMSPRTVPHRNPSPAFTVADIPGSCSVGGGGEGYHVNLQSTQQPHTTTTTTVEDNKNQVIAAEALRTIEKLNALVSRQESMLDTYSRDNENLWKQLRNAQCESTDKETVLQEEITSLKTKYQKDVDGLSKQVRTLQKILFSKEQTAPPPPQPPSQPPPPKTTAQKESRSRPLQRAKSSDGFKVPSVTANPYALIRGAKVAGVDASKTGLRKNVGYVPDRSVDMKTGDVLLSSLKLLENERLEYENVLAEKEKVITSLREEIESLKKARSDDEGGVVVDSGLNEELRSRIITQNRVIQQLKEHLSTFKKLETENFMLREEKQALEDQIVELRRKLNFIQSVGKPENEVLLLERVSDLENKFLQRERKLQTLLNKLEVKTAVMSVDGVDASSSSGGNGSSSSNSRGSLVLLDHFNNNNEVLSGTSSIPVMPGFSPTSFIDI